MDRDENRSVESRALSILRPAADARMTLRTAIWSSGCVLRRLLRRLALTATLLALVMAARAAIDMERHYEGFTESKERVARIMVQEVAVQAYARWTMNNPARRCPDSGYELARYLDNPQMLDPWGKTLVVLCEDATPYGMRVVSAGQDGKFETPDDIRSWEDEP